jgi:hypothetical protein
MCERTNDRCVKIKKDEDREGQNSYKTGRWADGRKDGWMDRQTDR